MRHTLIGHNDTYLINTVLNMREGVFIDTRGLSEYILPYISKARIPHTIYVSIRDRDFPVAFNPLDTTDIDNTASNILTTFKVLFAMKNTPQFDMTMLAALKVVLSNPNPSFLRIYTLLTNNTYRQTQHHKDPFVAKFWEWFNTWESREQFQRTMSTINKLFQLLNHTTLRNVLNQNNKLQFHNKLVLVDLSGIPKDIAALLGSLFMNHSSSVVVTDAELFAIPDRDHITLEYKRYKSHGDLLTILNPHPLDIKNLAEMFQMIPEEFKRQSKDHVLTLDNNYNIQFQNLPVFSHSFQNHKDKIIEQTRRKYCTPRVVVTEALATFIEQSSGRARASRGRKKQWKPRP